MPTVTDEALMSAVRDGDLAKLGLLFERYHLALFDFLSRMTGDRTAAEDLVQDIFVRILKYRSAHRDGGRFETWLFRIARNARADYFRTRRPLESLSGEAVERPEPSLGPMRRLEAAPSSSCARSTGISTCARHSDSGECEHSRGRHRHEND